MALSLSTLWCLCVLLTISVQGFQQLSNHFTFKDNSAVVSSTALSHHSDGLSRREVFRIATGVAVGYGVLPAAAPPALAVDAAAADAPGRAADAPIVVVGAGGKTGRLIVEKLARRGLYARGVTRDGRDLKVGGDTVSYAAGDVTQGASLDAAFKGASAVIFAASASKKGGDAAHVDYLGVANTAEAAIRNGVPRLVVISSGAVTRPESVGFKITNVFGRIMDYKIAGETALRGLYAAAGDPDLSYTVVRPGGLSDRPSRGPAGVELSQGDVLSAEIGREDVAEVTVAALLSPAAKDATIECYGAGGETLFGVPTGAAKLAKGLPDVDPKYVHRASASFEALFEGVLSDAEMSKTGLVSDYVGVKIESLDSLRK
mmetsp:Transcript_14506/g.22754  ORF Transcript_14506/g.22754 Transcript_14506/m.22754 type:complete len:374 (-) Transcript_14506:173-1294(-)